MTQSFACHIPSQNLLLGRKDELANIAPTKSNNTSTISHTITSAAPIAPPVVFALFFVAQYLENNF